jgi:DNA-directed RNA polymerase subunit H (RpoH/RPB5)
MSVAMERSLRGKMGVAARTLRRMFAARDLALPADAPSTGPQLRGARLEALCAPSETWDGEPVPLAFGVDAVYIGVVLDALEYSDGARRRAHLAGAGTLVPAEDFIPIVTRKVLNTALLAADAAVGARPPGMRLHVIAVRRSRHKVRNQALVHAATINRLGRAHNGLRVELFHVAELQYVVTAHVDVPLHFKIVPGDAHWARLLRAHGANAPACLCELRAADPVARFLGFEAGDVIAIERCDSRRGTHYVYRRVRGDTFAAQAADLLGAMPDADAAAANDSSVAARRAAGNAIAAAFELPDVRERPAAT